MNSNASQDFHFAMKKYIIVCQVSHIHKYELLIWIFKKFI